MGIRKYDPAKDFKTVIDWALKNHLIYWLKKTRGYEQATDWIKELSTNQNVIIFEGDTTGLLEFRDLYQGAKGSIVRAFWFSPNPEDEAKIVNWALEYCFSNGVSEIEFEEVSLQRIKKEFYNATKSRIPEQSESEGVQPSESDIKTVTGIHEATVTTTEPVPSEVRAESTIKPKLQRKRKSKPKQPATI